MYIKFHYPDIEGVEIPDKNILGIYQPRSIDNPLDPHKLIRNALAQPINSSSIQDMVNPKDKVLILVDDYTRVTPASIIIPYIIEELAKAGITKNSIKFMIALGTHRPMNDEELVKKLGKEIIENYEVLQHKWDDEKEIRNIGTTKNGTEILINRHVLDADFVIGIGQIFPHRIAGFSGGAKIIQPGVCGKVTTGQTHWLAAKYDGEEIEGIIDNPVRQELNEIGYKVGLKFIVNVVLDADDNLIAVVAGDPVEAHKAGAQISSSYLCLEMTERPDVVLIEAYPADIDLWQVGKAIYAAGTCVKEGGVIIVVSTCYEGVSPSHEHTLLKYGCRPYPEMEKLIQSGVIDDLTAAAIMAYIGDITAKADLILVTKGVSRQEAEALKVGWAESIAEAIEFCSKKLGNDYKAAIVRKGGNFLPKTVPGQRGK